MAKLKEKKIFVVCFSNVGIKRHSYEYIRQENEWMLLLWNGTNYTVQTEDHYYLILDMRKISYYLSKYTLKRTLIISYSNIGIHCNMCSEQQAVDILNSLHSVVRQSHYLFAIKSERQITPAGHVQWWYEWSWIDDPMAQQAPLEVLACLFRTWRDSRSVRLRNGPTNAVAS